MRKKNKRKQQEFKKPFLVLNRRKLFGWGIGIFFLCAWMFVLGVLVGRDKAPVKFDIKKLQARNSDSSRQPQTLPPDEASPDEVAVKDKTKLGFYERLPEDQKDVKVPEIKKQPKVEEKSELESGTDAAQKSAASEKKKKNGATVTPKQTGGPVYTIQAAAVKKPEDADRLVAKLKEKGYPAYRAIGKVPQKGIWFRVRVGKYPSRSEASKTLQKLKKLGLKPIIVKQ
jgi:cell division septation protein DedD